MCADPTAERLDSVTADARLALEATCGTIALADWNDSPGRTKEEVIALFESLAFDSELEEFCAALTAQQRDGDEEESPAPTEKVPVPA